MARWFVRTAVAAIAVGLLVVATAPPRRQALVLSSENADGTIAGIVHVHTNRSDGLSSPDDVAAAAARAGLKFLVVTDHGDATRTPDPPAYRSGILCLDAVEISTSGGHYIAIDMPAAPYPLAGEARDVVDDVKRLGGFGVVAHPDSPKPQLQWTDWTVPFDGVELLNLDTSWRVLAAQSGWASKRRLAAALLHYPVRAPETIATLIQPTAILSRWEPLARTRRLVTMAGADAHAKLALWNADPGESAFALPLPGYEPSFRVLSLHAQLDRPLTGNAQEDAAALVRAIRGGHVYTAVDGLATPPSFTFTARNGAGTAQAGDILSASGAVELHVRSNAPPGFTTVVHKGTATLSAVRDTQDLTVHGPQGADVYWAEIVSTSGAPPVTWVRSNPIYVRDGSDTKAQMPRAFRTSSPGRTIFDGKSTDGWNVEHDAVSLAAIETAVGSSGPELRFRFGLASGPPVGQYASATFRFPDGVRPHDALTFTIRAEQPMRVSVQVRDTTADRWQRSIYVDETAQEHSVAFDDFSPVGVTHAPTPPLEGIRNVMFVVDTTNTRPATSGRIWIRGAALATSVP
jgi:hypothetical protein